MSYLVIWFLAVVLAVIFPPGLVFIGAIILTAVNFFGANFKISKK